LTPNIIGDGGRRINKNRPRERLDT
jgi:hypothetical protein